MKSITAFVLCLLVSMPALAQDTKEPPAPFDSLPAALSDADTRLTTGVELLSRSATAGTQHLLIDLMLAAPITGQPITRQTKPRLSAWFNARFNGAPNSGVSGVKQFVGGFEDNLISGDVSSLLTALTFRGGGEISLGNGKMFQDDYQFQSTLIFSFGLTTVPPLAAPVVFQLSDEARARWSVPQRASDNTTNIKYIAFTEPDRRQFFDRWEVGARFKTHHFDNCDPSVNGCDRNKRLNFPGLIDVTIGQDSSLTGGIRRGKVIAIDGFYPLPTDNIANAVYLFGRLRSQWTKGLNQEPDPIILRAPDAAVTLPSNEVFVHTLTADERTRDDWKFGIGVDLIRLFKGAAAGRAKDAAAALEEKGFSKVTVTDHDEIRVQKIVMQSHETGNLVHGTDVFLPIVNGDLNVTTGTSTVSQTFVKDKPEKAQAAKRQYKNNGEASFETLLIRLKSADAKGDALEAFTLTNAVESKTESSERYVISKITCSAACSVTSSKEDNLLLVIPLTAATMTVTGANSTDWKAYEPIVVPRKNDFKITGGSSTFLVVRLK